MLYLQCVCDNLTELRFYFWLFFNLDRSFDTYIPKNSKNLD